MKSTDKIQYILGLDRACPKTLYNRLEAIEKLLETHPEFIGKFVYLQLAPLGYMSYEIEPYCKEKMSDIYHRFSTENWSPIQECKSQDFMEYRDADIAFCTPLHDYVTLMPQKFVACTEKPGVLILSQFMGQSMPEALTVNPYDVSNILEVLLR